MVRVSRSRLEDDVVGAYRFAGDDASAADEAGGEVVDDVAVKIRHNHDIELFRSRHQLHTTIVDNHRFEFNLRVEPRNLKVSN